MSTFGNPRTLVKPFAQINFAPAAMARVGFGTLVMVSDAPPAPHAGEVYRMQPDGAGGRAWALQPRAGGGLVRLGGWLANVIAPGADQQTNLYFFPGATVTVAGRSGRVVQVGCTLALPAVGDTVTVQAWASGVASGVSATVPVGALAAFGAGSSAFVPVDLFEMRYSAGPGFDPTDQSFQDVWMLLELLP